MHNINRLKDMLLVMEDCVLKLENFNNVYNSIDNVEAKIYMEEGFRGYIRAFQEQLIKYLAHTSKGLYDRKDKMGYDDIIHKHKSV